MTGTKVATTTADEATAATAEEAARLIRGSPRFLFVFQRTPYGSVAAAEALDLALAAAAFDRPVSLLFLGDGVWQLATGQAPAGIARKDWTRAFGALADFGIEAVFAEAESLAERGLSAQGLALPVRVLDAVGVRALLDGHEAICRV